MMVIIIRRSLDASVWQLLNSLYCINVGSIHAYQSKENTKYTIRLFPSISILYGLESVTLRKHDKNKLDAFHARCCRRILRISPAFVSRISNAYILQTTESIKLSHMILIRQLKFFGSLARRSNDDLLRSFIFHPDSHVVKIPLDRPRGRPRLTWKATMHKHACDIIHDYSSLISDEKK